MKAPVPRRRRETFCGARLSAVLACLALTVLLIGMGDPLPAQDLTPGTRPKGFERVAFDLDRFAQQSSVIVRGIVSNKKTKWVKQALYTHYELVVQETIQGDAQTSLTVAVLGGVLGNIGLNIPGAPNLQVGDEIIFFGQAFEGQPSFRPVGLNAGVVQIQPGDGGASTVAPRGKPEGLDEFLDEVRSRQH